MEILTLFAIALGLSFDTFAVSLSCGLIQDRISFRQAFRVALIMAFFQGSFPLAGYYLGLTFSEIVKPVDHWIAFGLLSLLGIRMIFEGLKHDKCQENRDITKLTFLVVLGIGTSIDAFVVGVSLGFLGANIWMSALIIAVITFMASMIAIRLGKSVGRKLGTGVEVAGGIILILIGVKFVIEHTLLAGV